MARPTARVEGAHAGGALGRHLAPLWGPLGGRPALHTLLTLLRVDLAGFTEAQTCGHGLPGPSKAAQLHSGSPAPMASSSSSTGSSSHQAPVEQPFHEAGTTALAEVPTVAEPAAVSRLLCCPGPPACSPSFYC